MSTRVQSLALLHGLRIRHCYELQYRSQTQLRSGVSVAVVQAGSYSSDLTPSLETSICCRCGQNTDKKKKKKQPRRYWPGLQSSQAQLGKTPRPRSPTCCGQDWVSHRCWTGGLTSSLAIGQTCGQWGLSILHLTIGIMATGFHQNEQVRKRVQTRWRQPSLLVTSSTPFAVFHSSEARL